MGSFTNMLLMAFLTIALLILGVRYAGEKVFYYDHGPKYKDFAYKVELPEGGGSGGEEKRELTPAELLFAASVEAGERAAKKCLSCHTFEKGGANLTGPNLYGVIGRDIASVPGFNYQPALATLGEEWGAWDYEEMFEFLQNPQSVAKGSSMVLRTPKPLERANIIAYLATLLDGEAPPFPEPPAPPAVEEAVEAVVEELP